MLHEVDNWIIDEFDRRTRNNDGVVYQYTARFDLAIYCVNYSIQHFKDQANQLKELDQLNYLKNQIKQFKSINTYVKQLLEQRYQSPTQKIKTAIISFAKNCDSRFSHHNHSEFFETLYNLGSNSSDWKYIKSELSKYKYPQLAYLNPKNLQEYYFTIKELKSNPLSTPSIGEQQGNPPLSTPSIGERQGNPPLSTPSFGERQGNPPLSTPSFGEQQEKPQFNKSEVPQRENTELNKSLDERTEDAQHKESGSITEFCHQENEDASEVSHFEDASPYDINPQNVIDLKHALIE